MKTRRQLAAEASCAELQFGSHIDSMPTQTPLPVNVHPVSRFDELAEFIRKLREEWVPSS